MVVNPNIDYNPLCFIINKLLCFRFFIFFHINIEGVWSLICMVSIYGPRHDKTNKVTVRPAKTQISLGSVGS